MIRNYWVKVVICGFRCVKTKAIKRAAEECWPFKKWLYRGGALIASEWGHPDAFFDEEEFVNRLATAIWRANTSFCHMIIIVVSDSEYFFTDVDYHRLMKNDNGNNVTAG